MTETGVDEAMLHILALDTGASVRFSTYTMKWYVSARIHVSDGMTLDGVAVHRSTPEGAVGSFLLALQGVKYPKRIVTHLGGDRHTYLWNGGAFAVVPDFDEDS